MKVSGQKLYWENKPMKVTWQKLYWIDKPMRVTGSKLSWENKQMEEYNKIKAIPCSGSNDHNVTRE